MPLICPNYGGYLHFTSLLREVSGLLYSTSTGRRYPRFMKSSPPPICWYKLRRETEIFSTALNSGLTPNWLNYAPYLPYSSPDLGQQTNRSVLIPYLWPDWSVCTNCTNPLNVKKTEETRTATEQEQTVFAEWPNKYDRHERGAKVAYLKHCRKSLFISARELHMVGGHP